MNFEFAECQEMENSEIQTKRGKSMWPTKSEMIPFFIVLK